MKKNNGIRIARSDIGFFLMIAGFILPIALLIIIKCLIGPMMTSDFSTFMMGVPVILLSPFMILFGKNYAYRHFDEGTYFTLFKLREVKNKGGN